MALGRILKLTASAGLVALLGCQTTAETSTPENTTAQSAPATTQAPKEPKTRANAAPNFTLPDLNGKPIQLSDYSGRVVMVDFWATWCGPCRRTIPDLVDLYKTHNSAGFDVLGVALERQGTDLLKPFAEKNGITYPILVGNGEVVQSYGGFNSIPTAFLIGRDGTIREQFVGVQSKATLEKAIAKLLAEPPPA